MADADLSEQFCLRCSSPSCSCHPLWRSEEPKPLSLDDRARILDYNVHRSQPFGACSALRRYEATVRKLERELQAAREVV